MDALYEIHELNYSKPEFEATLKASMMLLSNLLQKLSKLSDDGLYGLSASVSLVLYVSHSQEKTEASVYNSEKTMMTAFNLVSTWVDKQFQDLFQLQTQHGTTYQTEEMKVCSGVFYHRELSSYQPTLYIRQSVDCLCKDGTDTPIVHVYWKAC